MALPSSAMGKCLDVIILQQAQVSILACCTALAAQVYLTGLAGLDVSPVGMRRSHQSPCLPGRQMASHEVLLGLQQFCWACTACKGRQSKQIKGESGHLLPPAGE